MTQIETNLTRHGIQALIANNASDFTDANLVRANIGIPSVFRNIVIGLRLSTGGRPHFGIDPVAGGSTHFTIEPGMTVSGNHADTMLSPTVIEKTIGAWTLGSGGGALDTGFILVRKIYTVFQMKRYDSSDVDFCMSLDRNTPTFGVNIPLAYSQKYQPIGRLWMDDQGKVFRVYQWDSLKYKPTVALCAHTYRSVYDNGRAGLLTYNVPLTFFSIPESIDIPGEQGLLRSELVFFQSIGEVGAYPFIADPGGFPALRALGREVAFDRMFVMKSVMASKNFSTKTIVAQSRLWSDELADLSRDVFPNVCVTSDIDNAEPYPILDTNNIKGGGQDAFGPPSTLAEFQARLDQLELTGGLFLPPIHNLGTGAGNSLPVPVFEQILLELRNRSDENRIRICSVSEAMEPVPFH